MIGKLNHVAIAVPNLKHAAAAWQGTLGASLGPVQALAEHGVSVAFIDLPNGRIELMEPLGDTSPIAGFLARHPAGGMHHLCFEVDDLEAAAATLAQKGARALGPVRIGAHGKPVIFMRPADFSGTLIELEQS
jgi:methylmalonyl-CoA/ethylmalonyl-CoA epimerase